MVAIKGMEMPSCCRKCEYMYQRVNETRLLRCKRTDIILDNLDTKDINCPLVEIDEVKDGKTNN